MAYEIFISYRRKDTGGHAGRLVDHLKGKYGGDMVLFDLEVEGTAERLRAWVQRVVGDCAVELVLIGPDWIEDREGRRRLFEDGDIVRLEIELAIESEVPLVPVLVEGAPFPDLPDLPESLRVMAEYKGYNLTNRQWGADVGVLFEAIDNIVRSHLPILKRGKTHWEHWRKQNPSIEPNLASAELRSFDLSDLNLAKSDMRNANLEDANLKCADLRGANLTNANLRHSNLQRAILDGANLHGSTLSASDLTYASLKRTNLTDANLNHSNLSGANLDTCDVYGVSVWGANFSDAIQGNFAVYGSDPKQTVRVDRIQDAVLIHMLLLGGGAREMINAITTRTVLLIGRFTPERKKVLDLIRRILHEFNFVPLVFDFQTPTMRTFTETMTILASLSRCIIADITNPRSAPLELHAIVPNFRIPLVPIIEKGEEPFNMFADLYRKYDWVLAPLQYDSIEDLAANAEEVLVKRALGKERELLDKQARFRVNVKEIE